MWFQWWAWAAAAIVLGILETLFPTLVLLGFAIGAAVCALVVLLFEISLGWLLVIFGVASLLGYLAVRRYLPSGRGTAKTYSPDQDIND